MALRGVFGRLWLALSGGAARSGPPLGAVVQDYATVGLTLEKHPVAHVRPALETLGARTAASLREVADGKTIRVAGLVICRQRPQTASGIVFFTVEDETGTANLIVRPQVFEKFRRIARGARFILASGKLEREGEVTHLLVQRLQDVAPLFRGEEVAARSRDFH